MASTDHAPAPEPFSPHVRMTLDEFSIYRDWVREANELDRITVLLGVEADYYEGCEGFLEDWLPRQDLDVVLGSVHFNGYDRENNHALTGVYNDHDVEGSWTEYFRRIRLLADTGLYDIVGHLDLPKKFGRLPAPDMMKALVLPALDHIARADMAIEINTSGFIHSPDEQYPSFQILIWAHERGIPITFGSDSHTPNRIGADFDRAVQLAVEAGYTERAEYSKRKRTLAPLIAVPG